MPQYSPDEMYQAATGIVSALQKVSERLDTLESVPARDRLSRDFARGREYARSKGYTGKKLDELEEWMINESIGKHEYAIKLQPPIETSGFGPGFGLSDEEFKLLVDGHDNQFLNIATNRVLREARDY